MANRDKKPSFLSGLFGLKCPNCRKGFVFVNKGVFPLSKTTLLKENCDVCGQKLMFEKNNGAGMNYALTVIVFFLNLSWYCPLYLWLKTNPKEHWYENNSVEWYLVSSIFVVLLVQPWLMRLSRMFYLYMYVGSGADKNKF